MYKVFFDNRTIYFTDELEEQHKDSNGLFVRYLNDMQIAYVLDLFRNVKSIPHVFIVDENIEKVFQKFRTLFKNFEAAGGLVFNNKNQVLVIKRRGRWDLPKGKKEADEDAESCAIREVQEECGISAPEIDQLLHITHHSYTIEETLVLKKTYWYKMHVGESEELTPQTLEEITEARWLDPGQLNMVKENTFLSIMDVLKAGDLL
jgi:8-oxo-dGTP pyrophosphatase MutT (NUDIX family)